MTTPPGNSSVARWIVALGATGLLAGYVGPIILNPDANQGPLLGLLITGPAGVIAGLLLGVVFRMLPITPVRRRQALSLAVGIVALATLYACIPRPQLLGYVIDADVAECTPAEDDVDDAIANWEKAIARVTWASPVPQWRERARHAVADDGAVVLNLHIQRRSPVFVGRAPWNRGSRTAGPWMPVDVSQRYYARDEGSSCTPYLARSTDQYWPLVSDSSETLAHRAREWPPVSAPADFLGLQILGPVSSQIRQLLSSP